MTIPASLDGWWRCCICGREVNPEQSPEICPDCGHYGCQGCSFLNGAMFQGAPVKIWKQAPKPELKPEPKLAPKSNRESKQEPERAFTNLDARSVKQSESSVPITHNFDQTTPGNLESIGISRSSSFVSVADSLLSMASISSRSSIQGPEGAAERLAWLVFEDHVLKELWYEAIERITLERLERNLRRLVGLLGKDLTDEAVSAQERRVGRFVKVKATYTASLIRDELDPNSKSTSKKTILNTADSDVDGDEEELMNLERFQAFITGSQSFDTFRVNVRNFIRPNTMESLINQEIFNPDHSLQRPVYDVVQIFARSTMMYIELWSGAVLQYLNQKIDFWFRGQLPDGMIRITWTCHCGVRLYDDYEELQQGAGRRLERDLRRLPQQDNARQRLGHIRFFASTSALISSIIFGLGAFLSASFKGLARKRSSLPSYEMESQQQPPQISPRQSASTEQLFLILCIGSGALKDITRAYQPTIQDVDSDRTFFQVLRHYHMSIRRRWWSRISIWELQHIRFVHFYMYEKSLVDIKELNAVPPQELSNSYRYERCDVKPPIGSNLLMHYVHFPHEASILAPCLRKVPKKLNGELTACPVKGVSPGWGLHFEEGWSWKKILTWSCLIFILASALEGILYWKFEHSVQDAMAIGTFILSCFGIAVATLQAWLMTS